MPAFERGRAAAPERRAGLGMRSGAWPRKLLRLAAAAVLLWQGWGCLNPQPDDQPHLQAGETTDVAPVPKVETCDDNPLLAGCSAPAGGAASGAGGSAGSGNTNIGSAGSAAAGTAGSGGLEPDAGPGDMDARLTDAGTADANRGDADAP